MKTEAVPLGAGRIRPGEDSCVPEVSLTRRGDIPKPLPFWERARDSIPKALGQGRLWQLLGWHGAQGRHAESQGN